MLATALLAGLAVAEISLRVLGVKFDASLYGEDPVAGWRLRPNAHGWWVSEGEAYARINSFGMRDREYTIAKPPRTTRIAVLGDSMTAAIQVDEAQAWPRVLEQRLAACGAYGAGSVQVMNFGVPGYGTAQELLHFRHRVVSFAPDVVVLAFYPYNDVHNNHPALNPVGADRAAYFALQNGDLVLDDSRARVPSRYGWLRDRFGDVANRSRVLQLVAEVLVRRGLFRATQQRQRAMQGEHGGDMGQLMLAPPRTPEMREAWAVTEALILQFRREVEAAGMQFWLVSLPEGIQLLPRDARAAEVARRGIEDLYYSDRRLEQFARSTGIRAVVLAPLVESLTATPSEPLTFGFTTGHYTPAGNAFVGGLIAQRLCQNGSGSSR